MSKTKLTGFWTFFCNPKYWPIDDFLHNAELECVSKYRITSWQKVHFAAGQLGVIRVGSDLRTIAERKGGERLQKGIYAIVEIIGSPYIEESDTFKIEHQKKESGRWVVPIKYIRNYIKQPILLANIKDDFIIKRDSYLLKGIQAASMPLDEDAFNQILLYGEQEDEIEK
jgi:hypothetical protein